MPALPDPGRLLARLRFRHLQMLATLDATGGIRRASERLNLTQPAISKALSELEDAFGFALFERTPRGLVATAQGTVVLRGAALLVNEARQLHAEAHAADADHVMNLRIGTIPFLAHSLLPRVFARLRERGRVRAIIEEGAAPPMVDKLQRGELDALVLTHAPDLSPSGTSAALAWEALFVEQVAVIAPPGHRLARRRKISWAELAGEPWVLPPHPAVIRTALEAGFRRAGLTPPAATYQSIQAPTNVRLVAAGLGLGAVPAAVVRDTQRRSAVVRLPLDPPVTLPPVSLGYHRIAADHPRIAQLREAIHVVLRARTTTRSDAWQLV
jgi:DNA-binding transcriptional LysR family regulator